MITIDDVEFHRVLDSHAEVVKTIDNGEYKAGYLAAVSDAKTALTITAQKLEPKKD